VTKTMLLLNPYILAIALIMVAAACGVWDVLAAGYGHPEATVSECLIQWSRQWPILPLTVGVIIGHVFWK